MLLGLGPLAGESLEGRSEPLLLLGRITVSVLEVVGGAVDGASRESSGGKGRGVQLQQREEESEASSRGD